MAIPREKQAGTKVIPQGESTIIDDIRSSFAAMKCVRETTGLLAPAGVFALPLRSNIDGSVLPDSAAAPEPATLALVGMGLAKWALARRRVARSDWRRRRESIKRQG